MGIETSLKLVDEYIRVLFKRTPMGIETIKIVLDETLEKNSNEPRWGLKLIPTKIESSRLSRFKRTPMGIETDPITLSGLVCTIQTNPDGD